MQSNTLMALNNHLFEQLERLNDEDLTDEEFKKEIDRSKAMTGVSKQIIDNAKLALDAEKHRAEYGGSNYVNIPKMIE